MKQLLALFLFVCFAVTAGHGKCLDRLPLLSNNGDSISTNVVGATGNPTDPVEQFNLGLRYYNGDGVVKDYSKAANLFRKSAERGYAQAQYYLGLCYASGRGVSRDYVQAVNWFKKSAGQGNAEAQLTLGSYYYVGLGVSRNYMQAVNWFKKSAEQGLAQAQYMLGLCYEDG